MNPAPLLVATVALCVIALAAGHPLVVAASLAGALAVYLSAPGPHAAFVRFAAISALVFVVINPFVAVEGDRVLAAGPPIPLFDLEVTLEELLYGATAGMRLAATILALAAFLSLADPDRVQALASRIAPRSALTVALSARLLPTLRRDAGTLSETLRLRGVGSGDGRRAAIRRGSLLVEPLVATSLERGVDIAEAMAARGYGAGSPTRLPAPSWTSGERRILALGLPLALIATLVVGGVGAYRIYPIAGPLTGAGSLLVAGATLLLGVGLAAAVRRDRRGGHA